MGYQLALVLPSVSPCAIRSREGGTRSLGVLAKCGRSLDDASAAPIRRLSVVIWRVVWVISEANGADGGGRVRMSMEKKESGVCFGNAAFEHCFLPFFFFFG